MFGFIKKFFKLLASVSTIELDRQRRELGIFDLVSLVDNPRPEDVYFIYSLTDEDVYMLKWNLYSENGVFDAGIDKQRVYPFWCAEQNLYKISNFRVTPYAILMHSSIAELKTYAVRLMEVFGSDIPLMGVFVDPHDSHLMLVVHNTGTVDTGHSTVIDLTVAPTAGIFHFHQYAHVMRTRDIVNNYSLRPISVEDIVCLLSQKTWRKEIINDITVKFFDAIRTAERKQNKFKLYCRSLVKCQEPTQRSALIPQKEKTK